MVLITDVSHNVIVCYLHVNSDTAPTSLFFDNLGLRLAHLSRVLFLQDCQENPSFIHELLSVVLPQNRKLVVDSRFFFSFNFFFLFYITCDPQMWFDGSSQQLWD